MGLSRFVGIVLFEKYAPVNGFLIFVEPKFPERYAVEGTLDFKHNGNVLACALIRCHEEQFAAKNRTSHRSAELIAGV